MAIWFLFQDVKDRKWKRKRTERNRAAAACHHRDANHFHVFVCLCWIPPTRLHFFFPPVCVPLLLPLAKQTIKSLHGTGRDSTRCKHSRQPTTVFLLWLSCSLAPLIGCSGHTDVSSLMIFVTIKLIVVYGSEMQECGGKRRKWKRLMDKEVKQRLRGKGGGVIMG